MPKGDSVANIQSGYGDTLDPYFIKEYNDKKQIKSILISNLSNKDVTFIIILKHLLSGDVEKRKVVINSQRTNISLFGRGIADTIASTHSWRRFKRPKYYKILGCTIKK